jgi:hypothetical protein
MINVDRMQHIHGTIFSRDHNKDLKNSFQNPSNPWLNYNSEKDSKMPSVNPVLAVEKISDNPVETPLADISTKMEKTDNSTTMSTPQKQQKPRPAKIVTDSRPPPVARMASLTKKISPLCTPQNSIGPFNFESRHIEFFNAMKSSLDQTELNSFMEGNECVEHSAIPPLPSAESIPLNIDTLGFDHLGLEPVIEQIDAHLRGTETPPMLQVGGPSLKHPNSPRKTPRSSSPHSSKNETSATISSRKSDDPIMDTIIDKRLDEMLQNYARGTKPWMNKDILEQIEQRDTLFVKMKDCPSDQQLAKEYRRVRNVVVTLTRRAKREFKNQKRQEVEQQVRAEVQNGQVNFSSSLLQADRPDGLSYSGLLKNPQAHNASVNLAPINVTKIELNHTGNSYAATTQVGNRIHSKETNVFPGQTRTFNSLFR